MQFSEFERVMSPVRMARYVTACGGSTRKAMTLYRFNLRLSQEMFTIISCFEVCLRNQICKHYTSLKGDDWLRESALTGGMFDLHVCRITRGIINKAVAILSSERKYSHFKLMAEMDFGFWRYLFAQPQFYAGGQSLLQVFPAKPTSTPTIQYNHTFVFKELGKINELRNRIAHHEPICFTPFSQIKNTSSVRQHYTLLLQLFQWMSVDEAALLYGLDHITSICDQIDNL